MIIRGNTVGTTMPRTDYAQKDPNKADYLKNNPKDSIDKAIKDASDAKTAAEDAKTAAESAQQAANTAKTDAGNAASAAGSAKTAAEDAAASAQQAYDNALPKSGGVMTGAVTLHGIHLTAGVDYGNTLPVNAENGRLFFLEEDAASALGV